MMTMTMMGMRAIEKLDVLSLDGKISLHGRRLGWDGRKYWLAQELSRNGLEYVLFFLRYYLEAIKPTNDLNA